jgi:geranylgeranylglycerol-phosphate geranylgeranyltransferase
MTISAIGKLMRLENCAMAAVAVAIGFIVCGGLGVLDLWLPSLLLAVFCAFVITGAGNTINDYYDCKTDEKNAPHRPIPSGELSAKDAYYVAMFLFGAGIIGSAFINVYCFALASVNSLVLYLYARDLKSSVFVGNVAVSYLTASTFVFGALILQNPAAALYLALLAFLANVGREIIGDIEDISGDTKAGINTLAIKVGEKRAWLYGRAFILGAVLLSPLPYLTGLLGISYLVVVLFADGLFVFSVVTNDARSNQKLTKIAIFAGLVAFLVGALF